MYPAPIMAPGTSHPRYPAGRCGVLASMRHTRGRGAENAQAARRRICDLGRSELKVECVNGVVQVRPEIARVEDYVPGESLEAFSERTGVPIERLIRLNSNESPYPPSPRVAQALGSFTQYNLYPDPDGPALIPALAAYTDTAPVHPALSTRTNAISCKRR